MIFAICFLAGCLVGYLGHRGEVERDRRRDAALSRVFERRER
jgi:hypothetical protein